MAIVAIDADFDCLGSFLFVMAIGYKQIALYYSLAFFVYLLMKCVRRRVLLPPSIHFRVFPI